MNRSRMANASLSSVSVPKPMVPRATFETLMPVPERVRYFMSGCSVDGCMCGGQVDDEAVSDILVHDALKGVIDPTRRDQLDVRRDVPGCAVVDELLGL